jgi:PAS domain S-box-containing protein
MFLRTEQPPGRCHFFLVLTGVFTTLLGIVVILGWVFNIAVLKGLLPGFATMKFNTALSFVIVGADFLLLLTYSNQVSKFLFRLLAVVLAGIALLTLSQDVFHYFLGIDQLIITDYKSIGQHLPYPGRMSPTTSSSFFLLGISFLGIDSHSLLFKKSAQYMLHFVTIIAFVMLVGYLLKVPYTHKIDIFSLMAIHTAFAMFLLSIAASAVNYDLGLTSLFTGKEIGNIVARRLFPRMVIGLLAIGFVCTKLEQAGFITAEFGLVLSTVSFSVGMLFLIWDTLTEMNRLDEKRTAAEAETRLLNASLEEKVLQRTLALKHSNDRFIKLFNANPTCIAITNIETGKYVDINPAITELLGYTHDEIIGHTAAELQIISADYRAQMVESLATKGYIRNEDVILKDKDDNDKHCILSAELLEDEDGKYMMTFVYDITKRKIMEDSLKDSKDKLEILSDKLTNQNKQLLSFAHIISHNLRSPVSNLNLLVHFYKESISQEDKDDLWGNFETVVGHLNSTLDELLETLKIQEDTSKEREKLSFEKTFNAVQDILVGQIMQSKAAIKTDFAKAPLISYPKIYLESIMLNLVSNAIKYRSPERVPEINICTNDVNGQLVLIVQDNGLGIDLKRHAKSLFGLRKTFHRHNEAKGLGLFITKTQIEAMGGEITAESVVNEGTKFKVIFNKY